MGGSIMKIEELKPYWFFLDIQISRTDIIWGIEQ